MKRLIPVLLFILMFQTFISSCKQSPEEQLVYMTEALNNDDYSKYLGDMFGTVLKYSYVPDSGTVVIDYQVAGRKIFMDNEHYSESQAVWFMIPWLYENVNCEYLDLIAETKSNVKIFFYDSESDCKRSSALYSVLLTPEDIDEIKEIDYSSYKEVKETLIDFITSEEHEECDENHVHIIGVTFEGIYYIYQFHYPLTKERPLSDLTEEEVWDLLYGNDFREGSNIESYRIFDGMNIGVASEIIQGDNHMIVLFTPDQIKDLLMEYDTQQ